MRRRRRSKFNGHETVSFWLVENGITVKKMMTWRRRLVIKKDNVQVVKRDVHVLVVG